LPWRATGDVTVFTEPSILPNILISILRSKWNEFHTKTTPKATQKNINVSQYEIDLLVIYATQHNIELVIEEIYRIPAALPISIAFKLRFASMW